METFGRIVFHLTLAFVLAVGVFSIVWHVGDAISSAIDNVPSVASPATTRP